VPRLANAARHGPFPPVPDGYFAWYVDHSSHGNTERKNQQDCKIQPYRCQEEFEEAGDAAYRGIDDPRSPKISFIQRGSVATW
jgi:hypothetical protein